MWIMVKFRSKMKHLVPYGLNGIFKIGRIYHLR